MYYSSDVGCDLLLEPSCCLKVAWSLSAMPASYWAVLVEA